jgi:hypothetical protein
MHDLQNPRYGLKLFGAVSLLEIFVIITTMYLVVSYRFYHEERIFSVQPNTTGLTNKSTTRHSSERKERAIIFVGIVSAPQLIFRRNALRRSWLKQCKRKEIPCLFFTDGQDMNGNKLPEDISVPLHQEQLLHKDLILTQSPGGINFARRYLWMLNWANARYKFEYFLRVDDDYFVCMDRLLLELPHRRGTKLYWGHVHCWPPGIYTDELFTCHCNLILEHMPRCPRLCCLN